MLNLMHLLIARGCAVSFLAENPAHGGRYTEAMQQLGVEAWWHPWLTNPAQWMSEHGRRFDTVIVRSGEHTSEIQSLMRISLVVFCMHKKHHQTMIDYIGIWTTIDKN